MIQGVVYFHGPKTKWTRKIDDSEIIATFSGPWRRLVRLQMLNAWRGLDHTRCGYALLEDGNCLEQCDPSVPTFPEIAAL